MTRRFDYYRLLGVNRSASLEEIRQAYFLAAQRYHPDKNTSPGDTEYFLDVTEAYEILINQERRSKYDTELPPEEDSKPRLKQSVQFSRQKLLILDEPQLIYALLEVSHPQATMDLLEPTYNFCLVLDKSTSMQGRNMDLVKAAALEIMRRMKPGDYFSLVAFSDRAEQLIPASQSEELHRLETRIHMLQPSGGTEIFTGLDMGYQEVLKNLPRARLNHIILLTDGRTYGDEDACRQLANRAATQGIGISCLGIGSEWNDAFMDELVSITGGGCIYISEPRDIKKGLLERFEWLSRISIPDVQLNFTIPSGIVLCKAFRILPDSGELKNESPIILGSILKDASLKILMEFVVHPQEKRIDRVILLDGEITYPQINFNLMTYPEPVHWEREMGEENGGEVPPPAIMDALNNLRFYQLQELARLVAGEGDYTKASDHMHQLASHLLTRGEHEMARTALLEADLIQSNKAFSSRGRKAIKYGTRALIENSQGKNP
jgi:Ca-activated chloride channel family protein